MAARWTAPEPPPLPTSIYEDATIPDDAVCLCHPGKVGPKIFYVPSRQCILKVGSMKMSEVEAMRFIAERTTVPVPRVHEAKEENGVVYIYMSKVEGKPLGEIWRTLSSEQRSSVAEQLRGFVAQWRSLSGQFYGALWQQPCEDNFFQHLCLLPPYQMRYGPYSSRGEYNAGLAKALTHARPKGEAQLGDAEWKLIRKLSSLEDDTILFSHGDFHPHNIMIDDNCKVTAILDWGMAGFSIKQRDYIEAKFRARNPQWLEALEHIFPPDAKDNLDLFVELEKAIVQYSGL